MRPTNEIDDPVWQDIIDRDGEIERLRADARRLDWLDSHHFSAYHDSDPEYGLADHCVVVDESALGDRLGCVGSIRDAIDEAMARTRKSSPPTAASLAGTWPGEPDDGFEESIDELRHPERKAAEAAKGTGQ